MRPSMVLSLPPRRDVDRRPPVSNEIAVSRSDGEMPNLPAVARTASVISEPTDVQPHVYRFEHSHVRPVVGGPRRSKLASFRFWDPRGCRRLCRDLSQRGGIRAWSLLVSGVAACASTAAALS